MRQSGRGDADVSAHGSVHALCFAVRPSLGVARKNGMREGTLAETLPLFACRRGGTGREMIDSALILPLFIFLLRGPSCIMGT